MMSLEKYVVCISCGKKIPLKGDFADAWVTYPRTTLAGTFVEYYCNKCRRELNPPDINRWMGKQEP